MLAAVVGLGWLTRYLSPAEYGRFALGLAASTLLSLAFGSIAGAVSRFTPSAIEHGESPALLAAAQWTIRRRVVAISGVAGLCALITAAVSNWSTTALVLCTAGYAIAQGLMLNAEAVLSGRRLRREIALHKALQQTLNYAVALLLVRFTSAAALAMGGFMAGTIATAASEAMFVRRVLAREGGKPATAARIAEFLTQLRSYARPFERWGSASWLQTASDRWGLALLATTRETGLYAVAYQLGFSPLAVFSTLLGQAAEPIAYGRAGDASDPLRVQHAQNVRRWALAIFGVAGAVAFAGAWLFHRRAFEIVVDPAYWSASPWLPWMVLSATLSGFGTLDSLRWMIRAQPERLQAARIVTSLAGAALVLAGAAAAGPQGVIAGQIVISVLYLAWVWWRR